jgi:Raf kinase inhibitor-like YbhB/YbcL family protein
MKRFLCSIALGLLATMVVSCKDKSVNNNVNFTISSSSFTANAPLPDKYTCAGKAFGEGVAPELHWAGAPSGTKSYAIVFKDTSILNSAAPDHAFHWMIWNIPANITTLPEGLVGDTISAVMGGAHQRSGGPAGGGAYLGPCPSWLTFCNSTANPAVTDVYSFTIYAFNTATLTLPAQDTTTIKNYVRQVDPYFASHAIATAQILTNSGAVPTSLPFPCP